MRILLAIAAVIWICGILIASYALNAIAPADLEPATYYGELESDKTDVQARRNCKLHKFGTSPWLKPGAPRDEDWRDRTGKALALMGLPVDALDEIENTEPLLAELGAGASRGDGLWFEGEFTTSFVKAGIPFVCFNSTYVGKQVIPMRYWRIVRDGKEWHIVEPYACGNIGQIFPRLDIEPRPFPRKWLDTAAIPEPSSALLFAFAAFAAIRYGARS